MWNVDALHRYVLWNVDAEENKGEGDGVVVRFAGARRVGVGPWAHDDYIHGIMAFKESIRTSH